MPEEERLAAVLASWHEAREKGTLLDPGAVLRAHPDLAEELRAHFEALASFDRLLGAARAPSEVPGRLGEYRILRLLGRGGMGAVYEADQPSLGRRVALKVLHPALVAGPRAAERFRREARAAAAVRHPNLVPVYGMGEEDGVRFYAMERVPGRSLAESLEARSAGEDHGLPPTLGELARLFAGAAEGLHAAHEAGIVHRDVKPSNLLLDENGALRVSDFGLARLASEGAVFTIPGQFLGTPFYASPEQASGGRVPVDCRSDVYSLGATLYEALTGRPPFEGEDLKELLARILEKEPPGPRALDARIPPDLDAIVRKALQKDPADRYATAAEFARDLRRFADGESVRARPPGPLGRILRLARHHPVAAGLAGGVLLLLAVSGALGAWASKEERRRRESEYLETCAWSLGALLGAEVDGPVQRPVADFQGILPLLARAAANLPERPEAHLDLALAPGATVEEKLARLERARATGLGERAFRLARAYVYRIAREDGPAEREETDAAKSPPGEGARDAYFEGRVLLRRGLRREALARLDAAVAGVPERSELAFLARTARGVTRLLEGQIEGAVGDLAAAAAWGKAVGSGSRTELFRLATNLGGLRRDSRLVAVIPIPDDGGHVAVDPGTGRVFVLDSYNGGKVWILDGRSNRRLVSVRTEGFDIGFCLDAQRREVYVAQQFARTVTVLDVESGRVKRTLEIPAPGGNPDATIGRIALDRSRGRLFVVRLGEILAVDAAAAGPCRVLSCVPHGLPGDNLVEIALDPGAGRLFAARRGAPSIRSFDAGTLAAVASADLPFRPRRLQADPPRRRLFAVSEAMDEVVLLDPATLAKSRTLRVPNRWASDLAIDPEGRLYLAGALAEGPLSVWDAATLERLAMVPFVGSARSGESYVALDPTSRRVYVALEDGWVNVVEDPLGALPEGK